MCSVNICELGQTALHAESHSVKLCSSNLLLYPRLCMSKEYSLQEFDKMFFLLSVGSPDILPGILVKRLWKPNQSGGVCKLSKLWEEALASGLWLFWIQKQPVFLWINLASALFTAVAQKGKQKLLELVELHCIFCIHYTPCFDSKFSKLTDKKLLEIGFCKKVSVLRYFFLLSVVWALHKELNGSFRTIST